MSSKKVRSREGWKWMRTSLVSAYHMSLVLHRTTTKSQQVALISRLPHLIIVNYRKDKGLRMGGLHARYDCPRNP